MKSPFRLERLHARLVDLELARPLVTSAARFEARRILLIRADINVDGEHAHGFGEAAPLPGWTPESAELCRAAVEGLAIPDTPDSIARLDDAFPKFAEMPSLRFGVELAILDALARHADLTLRTLIAGDGIAPLDAVPVQYTVGAAPLEATRAAAVAAAELGYTCMKMKVGRASPDADIERIAAVRDACPDLALRLDANGAWTPAQARRMLAASAELGVDLVEQPLPAADIDALGDLTRESKVDIAADESCAPIERARRLVEERLVDTVVLKPSALGGLLPTAELIDLARSNNVRVVLSTLIESAVGRRAVAQLAAAHPDAPGPHGLATGPWFARDVAPAADRIENGRLHLGGAPGLGFSPTGARRGEEAP